MTFELKVIYALTLCKKKKRTFLQTLNAKKQPHLNKNHLPRQLCIAWNKMMASEFTLFNQEITIGRKEMKNARRLNGGWVR